jgi:hypothetical protein
MKNIPVPKVDDTLATTELSNNQRLNETSYPYLKNELPQILAAYHDYEMQNGNALNVNPLVISGSLKTGILKNYNSRPRPLNYIELIRKSSPRVCPMCGSLKSFSVDHLMPKEDYPEFSIYSKNLVPACDCNFKRGRTTSDRVRNVRVLHPYFDHCLSQRQLSCVISPALQFPRAKIEIVCITPQGPLFGSVEYHLEEIVKPSGLQVWLEEQWEILCLTPSDLIQTLPLAVLPNIADFLICVRDALARNDNSLGTPNNWISIFLHGISESPDVSQWLFDQHNSQYI